MPPPQRYPSPAKQLVALGRDARAHGKTFEEFWQQAIRPGEPPITTRHLNGEGVPKGAVVWPSDTADRAVEQAATSAMREAWRRAYDREPETAGERAVKVLHAILGDGDLGGMEVGSDVISAAVA